MLEKDLINVGRKKTQKRQKAQKKIEKDIKKSDKTLWLK